MLWIYLYLPQLPLDVLPERAETPLAIVEGGGSHQQLICCNAAATAAGVQPGRRPAAMQARVPGLRLRPRQPAAEQAALRALAGWAAQFTDRVYLDTGPARWRPVPPRQGLLLEVSQCLRYHGGLSHLLQRIRTTAEPLHYSLQIGVAPSAEGARLLAFAEPDRIARSLPELLTCIDAWPLHHLCLPPEVITGLQQVGIETIGALLRLPADQLARRHGRQVLDELRGLQGLQHNPRPRFTPPEHYARRFELLGEVLQVEQLHAPLRRMLFELQGYLLRGDRAVLALQVRLSHPNGLDDTQIRLQLMQATRDAVHLMGMLQERFERQPLPAAVTALHLQVLELTQANTRQSDLFDTGPGLADNWLNLIERLQARLGPEAICHPHLQADHRPERATRYRTGDVAHDRTSAPPAGPELPPRPFWLLPEPRELRTPPPQRRGVERIETGWWDAAPAVRDYYIARTLQGARLWIYQERGRWYLHGIWA